jgi:pyruvate dehydrogenase E2 component (dihydrolipoamide acetyltransferase)
MTNTRAENPSKPQAVLSRFQKIIGQKMLRSKQQIPCFYLQMRADVTALLALRRTLSRQSGVKVTTNDFFIRAIALAVTEYPLMGAGIQAGEVYIPDTVNVGFAVAAPEGLVVPVVKSAEKKTLVQIAAEAGELINKARSNRLTAADLEGACITLSNLGVYGVDSFIAVVTPGQCAVLAAGNIIETAVPDGGGIAVRRVMTFDLSADHRIVNGAYAARFLNSIVQRLQHPRLLAK